MNKYCEITDYRSAATIPGATTIACESCINLIAAGESMSYVICHITALITVFVTATSTGKKRGLLPKSFHTATLNKTKVFSSATVSNTASGNAVFVVLSANTDKHVEMAAAQPVERKGRRKKGKEVEEEGTLSVEGEVAAIEGTNSNDFQRKEKKDEEEEQPLKGNGKRRRSSGSAGVETNSNASESQSTPSAKSPQSASTAAPCTILVKKTRKAPVSMPQHALLTDLVAEGYSSHSLVTSSGDSKKAPLEWLSKDAVTPLRSTRSARKL